MPATPTTPPKHPNTKGTEPRTRLAGGPFVDTTVTLEAFNFWAGKGLSQGEIIDRLTTYALQTGFNPVTNAHPQTGLPIPAMPAKANPAAPKSRRG